MSYRDLRNLCEILRTVGYPRLVSIENFRNPNFPLIADVGRWLVNQYEPKADIPSSCDTEADRVAFIRTFAEFMLTKVQVKLNTKRLYQADGYAVKELIKVASVLYNAVKEADSSQSGSRSTSRVPMEADYVRIDTKELKETRALASHLVQKGVTLYDMLSKEVSLRDARQTALSKAYEHTEVERLIRQAIESGSQEAKKMNTIIENVQNNLAGLESKIEKKSMELERSQKRLLTLKKVRPAFMDEFEELQEELAGFYKEYVNRFRCLAYLQSQIEDMNRLESERKAEERLNKVDIGRNSTGEDFLFGNNKGAFANSSGSDDSSDEMDPLGLNNGIPPSTNGSSGGRGPGNKFLINDPAFNPGVNSSQGGSKRQIYGSMLGGEDESEDESDLILVDGDNDNSELGSDDEEDELGGSGSQKNHFPTNNGTGAKLNRGGSNVPGHVTRTELKNSTNVNGMGPQNDSDVLANGGRHTANGGKGYPVDNNNSTSRNRSSRPTTGGRNTKGVLSDEDDDF